MFAFTSVVTFATPSARDVEAFRTVALVLAFTSVVTLAVPRARDVDAFRIVEAVEAVPAEIAKPTEEEAMSVCALIVDVILEV